MSLQIRLLGAYQLTGRADLAPDLQHGRLQELLAYLVVHRGAPQSRQSIAFLLWPESSEKQARTNLRVLWHRFRKSLPDIDQYVESDLNMLMWRSDAPVLSDLIAFEQSLDAAQRSGGEQMEVHLRQAIGHYHGDFLPDCFSDWVFVERERLRNAYAGALKKLAARNEHVRDYGSAIGYARLLVQHDPVQEEHYYLLMRLHALNDNRGQALHVYHQGAGQLERELSVRPGERMQGLYRRLLQQEADATPVRPVERPRLVGRENEWQLLLKAWRSMRRGRTPRPMVIIAGEAGIGKTHLAETFGDWVQRQGFITIKAHCLPSTISIPYMATAQWLRPLSLTKLPDAWAREVARLRPALLDERPHLSPPDPLVEPWQKQRFFEGLAQAFLIQPRPLLFLLDDVHWCDEESLVWLDHLDQYDATAAFFTVATLRSGAVSSDGVLQRWRTGKMSAEEILLEPLNLQRTAELVSQMLERDISEMEVEPLYRFTEGNPLFVVETVQSGAEVDQGTLPETVQTALKWRVDQLSPDAQQLLETAAVIGRLFRFNVLAQACDLEEVELIRCLDECWRRRILRDKEDDEYEFSHGILRQVVYTGLSPMRQRWLHQRVAQAILNDHRHSVGRVSADVAHHFDAAGRVEEAIKYYQVAASRAQGLHALNDAITFLKRALALQVEMPDSIENRAGLYSQLGTLLRLQGRHEEARSALQKAIGSLPPEAAPERSRGYRAIAGSWLSQQAIEPAKTALSQASAALGAARGEKNEAWWHEWLELELVRATLFYYEGSQVNLAAALEKLQGPMEQYGSPQQRADFLSSRILLNNRLRRFRPSPDLVAFARESLKIVRQLDDPRSLARKTFSLGFQLLWVGQLEESVAMLRTALEMTQAQSFLPLEVQCLIYLSIAYRFQNSVTEASQTIHEALSGASKEANPMYIGAAQANMAWLAYRRNDADETKRLGKAALACWEGIAYPLQWLALFPLMALAAERGDLKNAGRYAAAMLDNRQQWLPERLQTRLAAVVDADPNNKSDFEKRLREAILEAERLHYL